METYVNLKAESFFLASEIFEVFTKIHVYGSLWSPLTAMCMACFTWADVVFSPQFATTP